MDLRNKEKSIHQLTKAETLKVMKWLDLAVDTMQEKIDKSIRLQVNRRIDELVKIAPDTVLQYVSDDIKDMFIF